MSIRPVSPCAQGKGRVLFPELGGIYPPQFQIRRTYVKKIIIIAFISAALVSSAGAMPSLEGPPNFLFEPAAIGMILPKDSVKSVEDGTTYYSSEKTGLVVAWAEMPKAIKTSELVKNLGSLVENLEGTDFTNFGSTLDWDTIDWATATCHITDSDGAPAFAYVGLLNSGSAKGKTFYFAFILPTAGGADDVDELANLSWDSISYVKPKK